jgi:hypothetical protein
MYSTTLLLGITSLILASTAHAQVAERALLNRTPISYGTARTSASETAGTDGASVLHITGERALLGTVEHHPGPAALAGATHTPIDGERALLGRWPSPILTGPGATVSLSRFFGNGVDASGMGSASALPIRNVTTGS